MSLLKVRNLHSCIQNFFESVGAGALIAQNGQLLGGKFDYIQDIGTLPQAGEVTEKYLKLEPGQVAILNDPYSGGTLLSSITLLTAFEPFSSSKKGTQKLVLAMRFPLRPKLHLADSIDEEGLRIPPTIIADETGLFTDILSAIASHPLAPDEFERYIKTWLVTLRSAVNKFNQSLTVYNLHLTQSLIQSYLSHTQKVTQNILSDISIGETRVEVTLDGGEKINLRYENRGSGVIFDFAGSTESTRYAITDSAAMGCCFAALQAYTEQDLPITAGSLRCFAVNTPTQSWLNSKYPKPTALGMIDGCPLVASTALKALSQINTDLGIGSSGVTSNTIDIEFEDGKHFYDSLAGGVGATVDKEGTPAFSFWERSRLQPSIEDLEVRFPIRVNFIEVRKTSGGRGIMDGGDGLNKSLTVLEPAKLKWSIEQSKKGPTGLNGGASGMTSELLHQEGDGADKKSLKNFGEKKLSAGDTIVIKSAGGGGHTKQPHNDF